MGFLSEKSEKLFVPIVALAATGAMLFFIVEQRFDLLSIFFTIVAGIVMLNITMFYKSILISLIFFTVPLSLKTAVLGEAALSLPAEFISVGLAGLFLFQALFKPTVTKKILYHPITIILLIDFLWLIITASFSTMPDVSFKRIFIRFIFITTFYFLLAEWFKNIRNIPKLFYFYTFGLLIVIFFTLKAHSQWDFSTKVSFNICEPFYADHTVYGACIAYIIPFIFVLGYNHKLFGIGKASRNWLFFLGLILLGAEFLSYSRAAWITVIVSLLFYGLIKLRVSFLALTGLIGVVCATFFMFSSDLYMYAQENDEFISNKGTIQDQVQSVTNLGNDASNMERINRWVCAVRMFEEKPLIGFGPGTYQFQYGQFQTAGDVTYISTYAGDKGNAHSEYLTYLSETGLIGMLNFIALVFATLWLGLKLIYRARTPIVRCLSLGVLLGITTFYVHGLFNAFIDQDKMAILVFGSLAALVALDVFHSDKKEIT